MHDAHRLRVGRRPAGEVDVVYPGTGAHRRGPVRERHRMGRVRPRDRWPVGSTPMARPPILTSTGSPHNSPGQQGRPAIVTGGAIATRLSGESDPVASRNVDAATLARPVDPPHIHRAHPRRGWAAPGCDGPVEHRQPGSSTVIRRASRPRRRVFKHGEIPIASHPIKRENPINCAAKNLGEIRSFPPVGVFLLASVCPSLRGGSRQPAAKSPAAVAS